MRGSLGRAACLDGHRGLARAPSGYGTRAMKRLRYLNPFFIRAAVRDLRRVLGGGGPRLVRVLSVDHPEGWIIPASTITIEVEAADGHTECFQPAIPIPFPWAWAYRIGRRLGVPIVSSVKPEHFGFKLALPSAGRRS